MHRSLIDAFKGKKVLVTGHTGFKGAWLSLWLRRLGADVIGYSLPVENGTNLFTLAKVQGVVRHYEGDIREYSRLSQVIYQEKAEVVFHLAAQSLVIDGYQHPLETFSTNAMGTVNLLEACRQSPLIKAIIVVTTDKCYENQSWVWGYRENDRLGGNDPYSASKAMAEMAAKAYHASFLENRIPMATVRAGNVIGGGDFSSNRIIPDCVGALMQNQPVSVRNPKSVRPWLYVLDALSGYLSLAKNLIFKGEEYSGAWNFGPREAVPVTVEQVVECAIRVWGDGDWIDMSGSNAYSEMSVLKLNWDKASQKLGWKPKLRWQEAVYETVHWFKTYQCGRQEVDQTCMQQIENYENESNPVNGCISY